MILHYLKDYLTIQNLLILNCILILLLFFIRSISHAFYPPISFKESEKAFLQFLDKFYIKNKLLNFLFFLVFISIYFGFFLLLRLLYLGYTVDFNFSGMSLLEISFERSFYICFFLVLYILFFVLIFTCIKAIFYTEVLKFYLYYTNHFQWLSNIIRICSGYHSYIIGPLALLFGCIFRKEKEAQLSDNFYEHKKFLENKYISYILSFGIKYTIKYKIFHKISFGFYRLFCFLYLHTGLKGIFSYLHYFILCIVVLIEFLNLNSFYYTYYILVFFYIYNIYIKWLNFERLRFTLQEQILYRYFYKNDLSYADQRYWLYNKEDILQPNSKENNKLNYYNNKPDFVQYVLHNLEEKKAEDQISKRLRGTYLRFFLILIFFMFILELFFYQTTRLYFQSYDITFILIYIYILLVFLHIKTYGVAEKQQEKDFYFSGDFSNHRYNPTFNIIFWIISILLLLLFWLLLFKKIFLPFDVEVIWSWTFVDFQIKHVYSMADKIYICHQYFNNYLQVFAFDTLNKDIFEMYLVSIDFYNIITEEIPLERCKKILEDFFTNYVYIHNCYKQEIAEQFAMRDLKPSWVRDLTNILIFCNVLKHTCSFIPTIISYYNAFIIIWNPYTSTIEKIILLFNRFR